jgi:hypothetical protein
MVKLPLAQLTRDADLIILGIVEDVKSERKAEKLYSRALISVISIIKRAAADIPGRIIVIFTGGTVGNWAMKVEDSPDYRKGETVFVFLKKISGRSDYRTVGAARGKLLVKDGMVLRENTPLDQFIEKIKIIMRSPN